MKINLAGYNIDADLLKQIKEERNPDELDKLFESATPETISAAYARISRYRNSVDELRQKARERIHSARRSNKNIVYDMGHQSVAEHAQFNFDIIGISRLAIEALEHHRLLSFTEKSQRYITLDGDFLVPQELRERSPKLTEEFKRVITLQNNLYQELYKKNLEKLKKTFPEKAKKREDVLKYLAGAAKEDARYIVSMATLGQLGMTLNARNLENVIRWSTSHPLSEYREIGQRLYSLVEDLAPSLVTHADSRSYKKAKGTPLEEEWVKHSRDDMRETTKSLLEGRFYLDEHGDQVKLLHASDNIDDLIVGAMISENSNVPPEQGYMIALTLSQPEKYRYLKNCLKNLGKFDAPPRAFELGSLTYQITLSSSAFAQLKRHRMGTLLDQNPTIPRYDPFLSVTVPRMIEETNMDERFMEVITETNSLYYSLSSCFTDNPQIAEYILTNSHKRIVTFHTNLRSLYNFSRQREDLHAQWDIRGIANDMIRLAREQAPLSCMLIGGKHEFKHTKEKIYI